SISDMMFFHSLSAAERKTATCAKAETSGFFPRKPATASVAFWGGIILPAALVALSFLLAFSFRRLIAAAICLLGLIPASMVGCELYYHFRLAGREWPVLVILMVGLLLMAGGIWLWRGRSPKERA